MIHDPTRRLAPTIGALGLEPRPAIDRVAAAGFRMVQIDVCRPGLRARELGTSARRDLLATLRRRELELAGLDCFVPPADLVAPEKSDRAAHAILETIDLASDLGGVPVSLVLPAPGLDPMADAIVEAAIDRSHRAGVRLADHAVPLVELTERAGFIGIDSAAWLAAGADPADTLMAHGDRTASVRLVDLTTVGTRDAIGDRAVGRLDVQKMRVAVDVTAYSGPLVVDTRQWPEPWAGLTRTKVSWEAVSP